MDLSTLQSLVAQGYDAAQMQFSITAATLGAPEITQLLSDYTGGAALTLTAASAAVPTADGATVQGTWTPGVALLNQASWSVTATFGLDASSLPTVVLAFDLPVGWKPSTGLPALAGTLFDNFAWADVAVTLSSPATGLPTNFPAQLGFSAYPPGPAWLSGLWLTATITASQAVTSGGAGRIVPAEAFGVAGPISYAQGQIDGLASLFLPAIAGSAGDQSISLGGYTGSAQVALSAVISGGATPVMVPFVHLAGSLSVACDNEQVVFDVSVLASAYTGGTMTLRGTIDAGSNGSYAPADFGTILGALLPGAAVSPTVLTDLNATGIVIDGITMIFAGGTAGGGSLTLSHLSIALSATPSPPPVLWSSGQVSLSLTGAALTIGYSPALASNNVSVALDAEVTYRSTSGQWVLAAGGAWPACQFFLTLAEGSGTTPDALGMLQSASQNLPAWISSATSDAFELSGVLPFGSVSGLTTALNFFANVTDVWIYTDATGTTFALTDVRFGVSYIDTTPSATYAGELIVTLTVGGTPIQLVAEYDGTAWSFQGGTDGPITLSLTDLVGALETDCSISVADPTSNLPTLTLDRINLAFEGVGGASPGDITFSMAATLNETVAGQPVRFGVQFGRQGSGSFSVAAYVWIGDDAFSLAISEGGSQTLFVANWLATQASGALDLANVLAGLGVDLAALPSWLDLTVDGATIACDLTNQIFVAEASSATYGSVLLIIDHPNQIVALGLRANASIDLSNLPLLDKIMSPGATLSLSDFQLWVANQAMAQVTATLQSHIEAYKSYFTGSDTWPSLPTGLDAGATTAALLSAELTAGGSGQSIILPLDGGTTAVSPARALPPAGPGSPARASAPAVASSDGTLWYNFQCSFGPLSISRIGLRYVTTSGTAMVLLDAGLGIGPLSLSLDGLGAGMALSSDDVSFSLAGIGVAYDAPPLGISGALLNVSTGGDLAFEGMLTVTTDTLSLTAGGYYGQQNDVTSMFVFAVMDEALGGPPAFYVTGLIGGFGYNSDLTLPTIDGVGQFPFLSALPNSVGGGGDPFGGSADPGNAVLVMTGGAGGPIWVAPSAGDWWAVAGVTFTSFQLINGQAVVAVTDAGNLEVALLGTAAAVFPTGAAPSGQYAALDLDIEVTLQPAAGVFSAQAVLSAGSFLLDPSCVLTGGFAFDLWFGDNPNAGDFVLTVGGYNPAFTPPAYYPSVPPVGFNWAVDANTRITGSAYLALTPALMMLGGQLSVTYASGNVSAWLNANADILIRWTPFWFEAGIGISVGVAYRLSLFSVTRTISAQIGCNLALWGPPTGGEIAVDWSIFSFSIGFGAANNGGSTATSWADVTPVLPNNGAVTMQPASGLLNAGTGQTAIRGRVGTSMPSWVMRGAAFSTSIGGAVPSTGITLNGSAVGPSTGPITVHPLGWTNVEVTQAITITALNHAEPGPFFTVTGTTGSVPAALFGSPPESGGNLQVPPADGQLVGNQTTGVTLAGAGNVLGDSAGPIVTTQFDYTPAAANGTMPLSAASPSTGDQPAFAATDIAAITGKTNGLTSTAAVAARGAIFSALTQLGWQPDGNDDPALYAANITAGAALVDVPLLVA